VQISFQVAGGDGTVGWVLSSLGALRELSATHSVPPVGVIPLGTGNDLSRSFGWVRLPQDLVDSEADILNMLVQYLEMKFYSEWSMSFCTLHLNEVCDLL